MSFEIMVDRIVVYRFSVDRNVADDGFVGDEESARIVGQRNVRPVERKTQEEDLPSCKVSKDAE
jgi:hypothetical protein